MAAKPGVMTDRHKHPGRRLRQPRKEFEAQDRIATQEGTSWNDWACAVLANARAEAEQLAKKE